jgi:hypothetical protein
MYSYEAIIVAIVVVLFLIAVIGLKNKEKFDRFCRWVESLMD